MLTLFSGLITSFLVDLFEVMLILVFTLAIGLESAGFETRVRDFKAFSFVIEVLV